MSRRSPEALPTELIDNFKPDPQSFYSGRSPDDYSNTIADRAETGDEGTTVVFVTGASGGGKSELTAQMAAKIAVRLSGVPNPEFYKKHMKMKDGGRPFTIENPSWVEGVKAGRLLGLISPDKGFGDWDEREVRTVTDLLGTVVDIFQEGSKWLPRRDRAAAHVVFIDGPMTGTKNNKPKDDDPFQDAIGYDRLYSLIAKLSQTPQLGMRKNTFLKQLYIGPGEQHVRLRGRAELERSKTRMELRNWLLSCGQIVEDRHIDFLLNYLPASVARIGAATQMSGQLSNLGLRLFNDGQIQLTGKQIDALSEEIRLIDEEKLLLTDPAVKALQDEKIAVLTRQVYPHMRESIGLPVEQINFGFSPQVDEYHSYPALRKHNPIALIMERNPALLLPYRPEETVFLPGKKQDQRTIGA